MTDNNKFDFDTVTLSFDNGKDCECAIVRYFEANGKNYIALLPIDENGQPASDDVFLYRYSESKDGEPIFEYIESDEEYEIVTDAFDEELDAMEYEELYAEEDEEN